MHPFRFSSSLICLVAVLGCASIGLAQSRAARPSAVKQAPKLRVFLLAGQSNMEGQAVVDLDHEDHYNGGRGTLLHVMAEASQKARYQHLQDASGKWVTRPDVVVWYRARGEKLKVGKLSIGYAVYDGGHHFGPELQFGHVVGDHYQDPVLLIKTAWGGKSLFKDFRPPSAGGEVGPYYTRMLSEYREALAAIPKNFPEFKKHVPELSGFVWFQGWNDMCDKHGSATYAENLSHLIRDVRKDLGAPDLPIVVGETGNADDEAFRQAQKRGVAHKDFAGNATFVATRQFLRKPQDSPNTGHGHHWYGNAESYFLIGDAMAHAMLALVPK